MRKLLFLFLFFSFEQFAFCQERPLTNDTIVCIVDTSNFYTSYKENPFKKNPDFHWLVGIKGHFYDHRSAEDADYAYIDIYNDLRSHPWVEAPYQVEVPINTLFERFTIVTDEWLNQQRSLHTIKQLVGFAPAVNYNYLIFKSDIDSSTNGNVIMHRVFVKYIAYIE